MTLRLNFNVSAVRSLLSLQNANRDIGVSTSRLSSGVRLNRAADDPTGMALANALRYRRSGVEQASDNVDNGIALAQTADGALGEINALLNRMRELAVNAGNEAPNDSFSLGALQEEFNNLVASVDRLASSTRYSGVNLLNGNLADNRVDRVITDARGNTSSDYYREIDHDLRYLPGGIQEGSRLEVAPPTGVISREHIAVTLQGAPAANTALNGQTQVTKTGTTTAANALTIAGGEQTTITGPLGSSTFDLRVNTTIGGFVDTVNSLTSATGATAQYDENSGQLLIESTSYGHGLLQVSSPDLTGGGNVGLLDVDTTDANANALGLSVHNFTQGPLVDDRTGLAATGTTLVSDLLNPGGNAFSDINDKSLRVFGPNHYEELDFTAPTLDEALEVLQGNAEIINANVAYNSGTNTITVTDDPNAVLPATPTVSNLIIDATTTLHYILTFVDGAITDPSLNYNPGGNLLSVTATPPQEVVEPSSLDLSATTVQDVLDFFNNEGFPARATLTAGTINVSGTAGPLVIHSDDLTASGLNEGLLDNNTLDAIDNGGTKVESTAFAMSFTAPTGEVASATDPIQGLTGNGFYLDNAAGGTLTLYDGTNNVPIAITAATTIQDVVDAINGATLGARAEFTGGTLLVTQTAGTLTVTSTDMTTTTGSSAGLLDEDTTAAGNGDAVYDPDPTTTMSYTDGSGVQRTVTMHHIPGPEAGLSFRTIYGGNQVVPASDLPPSLEGPRYEQWSPGAFRVALQADQRTGFSAIETARSTSFATRETTFNIHSGANRTDVTAIQIEDSRAAALGHGAGLANRGLASLADLVTAGALENQLTDEAIAIIDAAISDISENRGNLGAIQSAALEPLNVSLAIDSENLLCSESAIRDTDFAMESANFARQQILLQAATSMLAQANQIPNNVLQLLNRQ